MQSRVSCDSSYSHSSSPSAAATAATSTGPEIHAPMPWGVVRTVVLVFVLAVLVRCARCRGRSSVIVAVVLLARRRESQLLLLLMLVSRWGTLANLDLVAPVTRTNGRIEPKRWHPDLPRAASVAEDVPASAAVVLAR